MLFIIYVTKVMLFIISLRKIHFFQQYKRFTKRFLIEVGKVNTKTVCYSIIPDNGLFCAK